MKAKGFFDNRTRILRRAAPGSAGASSTSPRRPTSAATSESGGVSTLVASSGGHAASIAAARTESPAVGTGWIEGTRPSDMHEGIFAARADGVTFEPLVGYPERNRHRFYSWPQFSEAVALNASAMSGPLAAHPLVAGDDPPEAVVLGHLALSWGSSDLVVIPASDIAMADNWIRRFRAAGVRIAGADTERSWGVTNASLAGSECAIGSQSRTSALVGDTSPGWRVDPTGRHQHRYYGRAWTTHVSDNGKPSTDVL